jgi:hypothetical protein
MTTILFDGWPVIYEPSSPEALHLLSLLSNNPQGVKPVIAFPSRPPTWFPSEIETSIHPTVDSPWKRLVWEQRVIPRVFKKRQADLIHLTRPTVPLVNSAATVVSPASFKAERDSIMSRRKAGRIWERLREAAARGGAAQARAYFWPSDLPEITGLVPTASIELPPLKPSYFALFGEGIEGESAPHLPEAYILYHGPGEEPDLVRLLSSWSWAAGSIGEYYPLLVLGFSKRENQRLEYMLKEFQLFDTVRVLREAPLRQIPSIYEKSSALFHPVPGSPWGGPLRSGLASHIPIVAAEDSVTSALVKRAAYLSRIDDSRGMGAALITVIVEEGVADDLASAARAQTESWNPELFKQRLLEAYQTILKAT